MHRCVLACTTRWDDKDADENDDEEKIYAIMYKSMITKSTITTDEDDNDDDNDDDNEGEKISNTRHTHSFTESQTD